MAKKSQAEFLTLTLPHPPIHSRLGIPNSPRLSLRVTALRRQKARQERLAGPAVLGTGT